MFLSIWYSNELQYFNYFFKAGPILVIAFRKTNASKVLGRKNGFDYFQSMCLRNKHNVIC